MIPARKGRWFERWFAAHARSRLRARFGELRLDGAEHVRALVTAAPTLIVSNHTAWWDPLVALVLTRYVLRADGYAMMDARNLQRVPFFRRVGAFGVSLDDPVDGARAIRHAAKLLTRTGRLLWVFPQGRERPITERPLGFRGGSAQIARLAPRAHVIPVGIRYEFGERERPDVWVSLGAPMGAARLDASAQEAAVSARLDHIDESIRARDDRQFRALFPARTSAVGATAERLLAWLTR